MTPLKLNKIFYLTFLLFLIGFLKTYSQTVVYDSVHKQKTVFIDVRKTYEKLINKGYSSVEMLEYLGNYYYEDKDFQKSKLYFEMLFEKYKLSEISEKSLGLYKTMIPSSQIQTKKEFDVR